MAEVTFDRQMARSDRVRVQIADIAPWMVAAASAILALNWLTIGSRFAPLADELPLLAGIVCGLVAFVPAIVTSTRRGMVETTGGLLIAFSLLFASGAAAVTQIWPAGGALNMSFCGLLAVAAIFIWPRTWHFVVGTLALIAPPTLVLIFGAPDQDAQLRGIIFAVNCLVLNAAVFVLSRRTSHRAERDGQSIRWAARHDGLTELLNRTNWIRQATELLGRSDRHGTTFWILMIDLDRFKVINDTHGHVAGDGVLVRLAGILREAVEQVGRPAFAGRLGGDEFALAISGAGRIEIDALIARLHDRFRVANGYGALITISIGDAHSTGFESLAQLIEAADRSMYASKADVRQTGRMVDQLVVPRIETISGPLFAPPIPAGASRVGPGLAELTGH